MRNQKGLTIVELIIVVVVLGIIAGVIYSKVLNKGVDRAKINLAFLEANHIKEAISDAFIQGGITDLSQLTSNPSKLEDILGTSCASCSSGIYCICNEKTGAKYGIEFDQNSDTMRIHVECPNEAFAEQLEKIAKRTLGETNVSRSSTTVTLSYSLD